MTKTFYDKIPTYEELKQLDKEYEYRFVIYSLSGSSRLQITYNEEYNNKISIDYLEGSYLHSIGLPIYDKIDIIANEFYPLNRTSYNKIIKYIKLVKEAIIEELNKWELTEENNLKTHCKNNLKS